MREAERGHDFRGTWWAPRGHVMKITSNCSSNSAKCTPGADGPDANPTVIIVEDDPEVREALASLVRSVGWDAKSFGSVPGLLNSTRPDTPTCLVLDVRLPGRSGLDLQQELATAEIFVPIVFITGHGDIPMSVRAMKAGAIEFLTKPFRDQDLLDALTIGFEQDRAWLAERRAIASLKERYESLSPREREVLTEVARGRLNKQIAGDIGISEITVKVHRGHAMRKMKASCLPELARMVDRIDHAEGRSQAPFGFVPSAIRT